MRRLRVIPSAAVTRSSGTHLEGVLDGLVEDFERSQLRDARVAAVGNVAGDESAHTENSAIDLVGGQYRVIFGEGPQARDKFCWMQLLRVVVPQKTHQVPPFERATDTLPLSPRRTMFFGHIFQLFIEGVTLFIGWGADSGVLEKPGQQLPKVGIGHVYAMSMKLDQPCRSKTDYYYYY